MSRESSLPQMPHGTGKKIGLGSIGTLVVALFSTPGFISWIQDGDTKAEVAYEVLQAEINALKVAEERRFDEMQRLRQSLLFIFMQSGQLGMPMYADSWGGGTGMAWGGGAGELMPPETLFPVSADGDGDGDSDGVEGAAEGVSEPPPPSPPPTPAAHHLEQLMAPSAPPNIEQRPMLPDNLDEIMKKK